MRGVRRAARFTAASLTAITVAGCGAATPRGETASVTSTEATPAPATTAAAPAVDVARIVESIPGYTYGPAPQVEQVFAEDLAKDPTRKLTARVVLRDGEPQGNIVVIAQPEPVSADEQRDFLAGALNGGNRGGRAERAEIGGVSAVKSLLDDGATSWAATKGRYSVLVGARPDVADDITTKLLARLPA